MMATNCPILKLIPLSPSECASALSLSASDVRKFASDWHIPLKDTRRRRPILWLKLCSEDDDLCSKDDDIVDGDAITANPPGPTRYAHSDADGNYTCVMPMGRTAFSNIIFDGVSRAVCDIGMTRRVTNNDVVAWIEMRKSERQHLVHLDGNIIDLPINRKFRLRDKSILSLYGVTGFAYRISIESNRAIINADASGVASRKRGIAELRATDTEESQIEKNMKCLLCSEIIVKAIAISPCLHNVCENCTKMLKATECPTCGEAITKLTPNKPVDAMIWGAALDRCFRPTDVCSYLRRRGKANMEAPTEAQKILMMSRYNEESDYEESSVV